MKKKCKSLLALMLALVMVGSLVACGEKPVDTPEEPDGPIEVLYWGGFTKTTGEYMGKIIEDFNASQDKYVIVREYNGGIYDQLAKMMATEKESLPAMCNASSETVGSYYHSGLLKPVQDFIDADSTYEDPGLYGNLISTYGKNGELIGYPIGLSLSGFYYNKAVFAAAGIDAESITSFEALYDACLKIGEGGYAKYALTCGKSGIYANYCFAREGYDTVDNNNAQTGLPTKCLYDDNSNGFADVVYDYYYRWYDLANKGYVYPVTSDVAGESAPALAAGELAAFVGLTSSWETVVAACEGTGAEFGFVPMFSATENGAKAGFCSSGNGMFIVDNGNEEAMKGAWEFIKYFTSVEVQVGWEQAINYMPLYDEIYNHPDWQAWAKENPGFDATIKAIRAADDSASYAFTATNNEFALAGQDCLQAVTTGVDPAVAIAEMCTKINDAFEIYNKTNS